MDVTEVSQTSDNTLLSLPISEVAEDVRPTVTGAHELSLSGAVRVYIDAALAENTRRAYQGDLDDFCRYGGRTVPCTPEVLALYIAERAETLSPYTITRRVVGISRAHVSQGFADPAKSDLVRTVLRGVRRKHGGAQRQAAPLLKQDLLEMLDIMHGPKGIRDRAMILLGFAAALRRSELVGLNVQDLQFVKEGLVIHLSRSKTDQAAEGRRIAVPYGRTSACPVKAIQRWLALAQIVDGPAFRPIDKRCQIRQTRLTAQSVGLVLKGYARALRLDATTLSAHSLRAGLVTSAAKAGVAVHKIQQQTGHHSIGMLTRYIRDANLFEGNVVEWLL